MVRWKHALVKEPSNGLAYVTMIEVIEKNG